jgi:hypothetical protein
MDAASGNDLGKTINYWLIRMSGAASNGLGSTAK